MTWHATLSWDDGSVEIGDGSDDSVLVATEEGLEGWYSTPESKWDLTERSYSDGAFDLAGGQILYAARVVTLHMWAKGASRAKIVEAKTALSAAAHRECTLQVQDGDQDTYVTGYPTIEDSAGRVSTSHSEIVLTLECPNPYRYASDGTSGCQECTLEPSEVGITGGLYYGEDNAGLVYDLSYGTVAGESGNVGTLSNNGSATAYPLAYVYGTFTDGFTLIMTTGGTSYTVAYSAKVTKGNPVVLDYRLRRATVAGLDRSRYLTSRGFHGIEPGSSATFNLQAEGSGYANVEVRDTYV